MRNPFTCSDPQIIRLLTILIDKVNCMSETVDTLAAEITKLQADVAAASTVEDSAVALISGFSAQLQAAVAAAQAAGATPDQLQSLNDLGAAISGKTDALSAAVVSQTPAAPANPAAPAP